MRTLQVMMLLLEAQQTHMELGHAPLASPLHELWSSLAADECCLPAMLEMLLAHMSERVPLETLLEAEGLTSAEAEPVAQTPRRTSHARRRKERFLYEAVCSAVLAVSSVQPTLCARLLAQQLAPAEASHLAKGVLSQPPAIAFRIAQNSPPRAACASPS